MKKNKNLGAACGRIHPTGGGFMTWYQKYEYAIGHWMQKATEHVLGCVLCSPGCFSLFRGSALMDFNVMRMYTKVSELPMHFIQYDQVNDAPFFRSCMYLFSKNCMKKTREITAVMACKFANDIHVYRKLNAEVFHSIYSSV